MKVFLDSLKHACKVPNTEQPFACVDLVSYFCKNKRSFSISSLHQ